MSAQIPNDCDPSLIEIAKEVCVKEGIDFDSLSINQTRGLMYYWCSDCSRTYPLSHLIISRRKKVCTQCNNAVKLYATSNKFGKLRRIIFFKQFKRHKE